MSIHDGLQEEERVSVAHTVMFQVLELIRQEQMRVGDHMAAQRIADRLGVSRSPVNKALKKLCEKGVVARQENRGYFLARVVDSSEYDPFLAQSIAEMDATTKAYYAIADDLLKGTLPLQCSDRLLRSRYGLTAAQAQSLLTRISSEGWVVRKPGQGWEFSAMVTTPDSLLQLLRLRLALEPAALLEPTFSISRAAIEQCRSVEIALLNGGIESATAYDLHNRGVRFHETLMEASGNPYFLDTIRRVNKIRRLLSYRSTLDRSRYQEHGEQHLEILALLEQGKQAKAARALQHHLQCTLKNLESIRSVLDVAERPQCDR